MISLQAVCLRVILEVLRCFVRSLHRYSRSCEDWHQPRRFVLQRVDPEVARLPSAHCICTAKKAKSLRACHRFNRSYQGKESPAITGDEVDGVEYALDFCIIGEVGKIQTSEAWFHQRVVRNFNVIPIDTMAERHMIFTIVFST